MNIMGKNMFMSKDKHLLNKDISEKKMKNNNYLTKENEL